MKSKSNVLSFDNICKLLGCKQTDKWFDEYDSYSSPLYWEGAGRVSAFGSVFSQGSRFESPWMDF